MDDYMNNQQAIFSEAAPSLPESNEDRTGDFTLHAEAISDVPDGDIIELGGEFDYEGYQVVRREFFAHINEPSITFNGYKVYVNAACINRFPSVDYVQILVNRDKQLLAIRPCREEEKDAFSWCNNGKGKRKAKQITCRLFFVTLFNMMGWNMDYRYKLLGKVIHANDEYLIAFDLTATEVYQRIQKEGEKPRTSRKPVFPVGWENQFGLPFKEHRQSMQIDLFDGYAVYKIKENAMSPVEHSTAPNGLQDDTDRAAGGI